MEAHLQLTTLTLLGLAIGMSLWERARPARPEPPGRLKTQGLNWGLGLANGLALRILLPLGQASWALWLGAGLWESAPMPGWLQFLALDLGIYLQHRAMHRWRWLWRLHAPHHADTHIDASTGLRFHPLEILLSTLWKGLLIALVGASVEVVLIFESVLLLSSVWSHSNVVLPPALERKLGALWLTPARHRVHHSTEPAQQRSNFGFGLLIWDRLSGSLRAPTLPPVLGIAGIARDTGDRLGKTLLLPFTIK
jgi:sterol desaturase/sphingolipid hydroxylase (fatty acid hydroxylase superfamily)